MFRVFMIFFLLTFTQMQAVRHTYMERVQEAREQQAREEGVAEGQLQQHGVNKIGRDIRNDAKPEVITVTLEDPNETGKLGGAYIQDIYRVDYMASGVVGLVGAPVQVYYSEDFNDLLLTFYYDPEELRGMPERNFIILHETEDGTYDQVGIEEIDTVEKTVSVSIDEPGVYLLADRYQWYTVWGVDVSDYAYTVDPEEYESDWERECDTGSIMELADVTWALENGPNFHVSTPWQLASVVWYVNAYNDLGLERIALYLEDDIDLAGYDWVPMGWLGPMDIRFDGVIDGQGHTISNMDIHIPYDNHCAFIGHSTGVEVKNITFENAHITGGYYAGIVGAEIYISPVWTNVHVTGRITDSYGEVGSIIGREAGTTFKDCSADVIAERGGTEKKLEYFSQRLEWLEETPATEDFTLTVEEGGKVTRSTGNEEQYQNLMWHVEVDGVQVLQRSAENETSFNPMEIIGQRIPRGSDCRIWLVAYSGKVYARVSNIVEYPTE